MVNTCKAHLRRRSLNQNRIVWYSPRKQSRCALNVNSVMLMYTLSHKALALRMRTLNCTPLFLEIYLALTAWTGAHMTAKFKLIASLPQTFEPNTHAYICIYKKVSIKNGKKWHEEVTTAAQFSERQRKMRSLCRRKATEDRHSDKHVYNVSADRQHNRLSFAILFICTYLYAPQCLCKGLSYNLSTDIKVIINRCIVCVVPIAL